MSKSIKGLAEEAFDRIHTKKWQRLQRRKRIMRRILYGLDNVWRSCYRRAIKYWEL